jgi:hypothetical protein
MNSKSLQSANKEAATQSEVHIMYKKRVWIQMGPAIIHLASSLLLNPIY